MANRDEPAIFQARVAKNSNSDALYLYEYQWILLDATANEPTSSSDYLSYQPLDGENTSSIKIPNPTLHFIPGDVIRLLTPQGTNFGLKLYKISNSLVNGVYDFVVDSNAVATESQNKLEYQPQASALGDDFYGFLCTSETSNFLSDDYYILLDTSGSFTISSDDAKILQTTQDVSFFAQPGQSIKIKSFTGSEQILTVASSQYNELSFTEDITIGNVSEIYIQDNKLQIVFILSGAISNGQFDNGDILDNVTEGTTFQEASFTNPNPLQPSEDIDPLTITPSQDEVDPNLEVSIDSLRTIQKINGKVSFGQIENFIESAKDIDISDNNLSLENLFNQSTGDEIDLTAGDRIRPHKMSEFLGASTFDQDVVNIADRPLGVCGAKANILVYEGGYGADSNRTNNAIGGGVVKTIPCGAKTLTTEYQDYEKFLGIKMQVDPYLFQEVSDFSLTTPGNKIYLNEDPASNGLLVYSRISLGQNLSDIYTVKTTYQENNFFVVETWENINLNYEDLKAGFPGTATFVGRTNAFSINFGTDLRAMYDRDRFFLPARDLFGKKYLLINGEIFYIEYITSDIVDGDNYAIVFNLSGNPTGVDEVLVLLQQSIFLQKTTLNFWQKYRVKVFGPQRYPVDTTYRTNGDHFGASSWWEVPIIQGILLEAENTISSWTSMNSAWVKMIYELSGKSVNFSRIPCTPDWGGGSIHSNIWNIIANQTNGLARGWLNNSAFNPEGFNRTLSAYTYYPQFNNRGGGGRSWFLGWHSKYNYGGDAMSYLDFFWTAWQTLRRGGARNAFGYFLTKGIDHIPSLFYGPILENLSGGWVASDGTKYPTLPVYLSQLIRNGELNLSGSSRIKFEMGLSPGVSSRGTRGSLGMIPVIDAASDRILTNSGHQSLIYDITTDAGSSYLQREPKINSTNALADFPGRHTVLDFGEVARRNSGGSYLNNIYTQDNYYYQEGLAKIEGSNKYILSENESFLNRKESFVGGYVFLRHIDGKLIIDSVNNTLPEYIPDFPEAYNPKFLTKNNVLTLENKDDELSNSNINYTSDWFFKSRFNGSEFIDDNNIISISPDPRVVSQGETDSLSHSLFGNITSIKLSGERNFWGKFERGSSTFWLWFSQEHVPGNWAYLYTETSGNTGISGWVYIIKDPVSTYDFLYFHYEMQLWYGVNVSEVANVATFANFNSSYIFSQDNRINDLRRNSIVISEQEYNQLSESSSIMFNNSVLSLGKDAFKLESVSNEAIAYVFFDGNHIPEGNLSIEAGNIAQYGLTKEGDGNRYGIMAQNGGLLNLEKLGNPEYPPTVAEKQTATVMWESVYYNQKKYFVNTINKTTESSSNWCHIRGAHFVKYGNQIKEDLISKNQDYIFRQLYKKLDPNRAFYLISRAVDTGFGLSLDRSLLINSSAHSFYKTFPRHIVFKEDRTYLAENTGVDIQVVYNTEISESLKRSIDNAAEFIKNIVLDYFCITMIVDDINNLDQNKQQIQDRGDLIYLPIEKINYGQHDVSQRAIKWRQRDLDRAESYGMDVSGITLGSTRISVLHVKDFTIFLNMEKINSEFYQLWHDEFGGITDIQENHLNRFSSIILSQIIKALGVGTLWGDEVYDAANHYKTRRGLSLNISNNFVSSSFQGPQYIGLGNEISLLDEDSELPVSSIFQMDHIPGYSQYDRYYYTSRYLVSTSTPDSSAEGYSGIDDAIQDFYNWNEGESYNIDDKVFLDGIFYSSISSSNTGNNPSAGPNFWEKLDNFDWVDAENLSLYILRYYIFYDNGGWQIVNPIFSEGYVVLHSLDKYNFYSLLNMRMSSTWYYNLVEAGQDHANFPENLRYNYTDSTISFSGNDDWKVGSMDLSMYDQIRQHREQGKDAYFCTQHPSPKYKESAIGHGGIFSEAIHQYSNLVGEGSLHYTHSIPLDDDPSCNLVYANNLHEATKYAIRTEIEFADGIQRLYRQVNLETNYGLSIGGNSNFNLIEFNINSQMNIPRVFSSEGYKTITVGAETLFPGSLGDLLSLNNYTIYREYGFNEKSYYDEQNDKLRFNVLFPVHNILSVSQAAKKCPPFSIVGVRDKISDYGTGSDTKPEYNNSAYQTIAVMVHGTTNIPAVDMLINSGKQTQKNHLIILDKIDRYYKNGVLDYTQLNTCTTVTRPGVNDINDGTLTTGDAFYETDTDSIIFWDGQLGYTYRNPVTQEELQIENLGQYNDYITQDGQGSDIVWTRLDSTVFIVWVSLNKDSKLSMVDDPPEVIYLSIIEAVFKSLGEVNFLKQKSLKKLISQYYIDYNSNSEILIDPVTLGFLHDLGYNVDDALDRAPKALRHSNAICENYVSTQEDFDSTNYEMI